MSAARGFIADLNSAGICDKVSPGIAALEAGDMRVGVRALQQLAQFDDTALIAWPRIKQRLDEMQMARQAVIASGAKQSR